MPGELILLVDDEANLVRLAKMHLELEGFRVDSAGDSLAALQAVDCLRAAGGNMPIQLDDLIIEQSPRFPPENESVYWRRSEAQQAFNNPT